ncbi:hypothetical protein RZS08_17155, partial [Arthrospira platensis SPKY1]|nr:hypothetical protein [Arthrospira platensis SPKY1]
LRRAKAGHQIHLVVASLRNIANFKVNRSSGIVSNLRHDLIQTLMPFGMGLAGIISEHADFVYQTLFWDCSDEQITLWQDKLQTKLQQVFSQYFPEGTEKPQMQLTRFAYNPSIDWVQQKRAVL